jgi:hypothetical protein
MNVHHTNHVKLFIFSGHLTLSHFGSSVWLQQKLAKSQVTGKNEELDMVGMVHVHILRQR